MRDVTAQFITALKKREVSMDHVNRVAERLSERECSLVDAIRETCRDAMLEAGEYQGLLSELVGVPFHSMLTAEEVDESFTRLIPIRYARAHHVIGLRHEGAQMAVVTDDLDRLDIIDHVAIRMNMPTTLELAPSHVIDGVINQAYSEHESDFDKVIDNIVADESSELLATISRIEDGDLLDNATRAPVIKLVNMILFEAVKRRASDVHIQSFASHIQVRLRIDGVLYDYLEIPVHLLDELVSRVKVIGEMDIAEKRLAQDGRTTVTVGEKSIDLRISIIPTSRGERVVLRLLDKSARLYELPELGMSVVDQSCFEKLVQRTHGIILVTGPTGSGKSTTLYAALQHLDCKEKNILTLEDPIEYQLSGISQTQVSHKKGMTFATGLRSILRQDPDIIMVGEIRDEETARMAVQSSLTGHLVFSTLHTNDAASAITRLLDLGLEPYLIASSLLAVLAQRLVRLVCPSCSLAEPLCEHDIRKWSLDPRLIGTPAKRARGCTHCSSTGYVDRKGIFELLIVDEEVRGLIANRAKASTIKAQAIKSGMTTLRQDGIRKFVSGATTLEEVSRVTYQDEMLTSVQAGE